MTPARPYRARGLLWILAAMAILGVVLGLLLRGGGSSGPDGARGAAGNRAVRPDRSLGASAGPLANHVHRSAADVLGALRDRPADVVRVEGHVLDALTRDGVGGVEVVYVDDDGETSATADDDGHYAIDVRPGEYHTYVRGDHVISVGPAPFQRLPGPPDPLAASAPVEELAPSITIDRGVRGVDLEVQRSGVIDGTVVDGDGHPIAGATVRARGSAWRPVLGTDIAESAPDGTFRLEVPVGFYGLDATHPDFAGARPDGRGEPTATVYAATDTPITLTMVRGCIVEGRAVHPDGSPVGAGALERMGQSDFYPAGPIADDGTFRFAVVEPGDLTVRAWPWKSPPSDAQTVSCEDGVRRTVQLVVPDAAPDLTGTIIDDTGAPAAGAYIDVFAMSKGGMNQQERADASGNWAVYALPPGEYQISATVPGHGFAQTRAIVPGPPLALSLSGTGSITGHVAGIDDGGTFQLQVGGCNTDAGQSLMPPIRRMVPVTGGTFRVDGLPACKLVAQARGPDRTTTVEATVVSGAAAAVDLDLTAPRRKTVHVRVLEADGQPVDGATVVLAQMSGMRHTAAPTRTDSDGGATLEGHVGDIVHTFVADSSGHARSGEYQVSDSPGADEDAVITLDATPDF